MLFKGTPYTVLQNIPYTLKNRTLAWVGGRTSWRKYQLGLCQFGDLNLSEFRSTIFIWTHVYLINATNNHYSLSPIYLKSPKIDASVISLLFIFINRWQNPGENIFLKIQEVQFLWKSFIIHLDSYDWSCESMSVRGTNLTPIKSCEDRFPFSSLSHCW